MSRLERDDPVEQLMHRHKRTALVQLQGVEVPGGLDGHVEVAREPGVPYRFHHHTDGTVAITPGSLGEQQVVRSPERTVPGPGCRQHPDEPGTRNGAGDVRHRPLGQGTGGVELPGLCGRCGRRHRRPYEGADNARTAMEAYLVWEFGLVGQLERDGTHHFRVVR
ncbi:hypothetical protein [Nonomuraea jabiensis]|uniref:Uncharacterized protein n=1 Tax=Nonomuraea jabiensis TaxID=882448 RepID=A0A7W9GGB9_9ACTN|nr:hypothetical protein [Nonomuraea jabiensis]MBB5783173.1 hypothetical protein [Nonomuraea jabiensis]